MSTPQPEAKRIAGVIVTHGHLAGELLAAAEMIVGPISHIAAVSIGWHDDVDAARDEVQRASGLAFARIDHECPAGGDGAYVFRWSFCEDLAAM